MIVPVLPEVALIVPFPSLRHALVDHHGTELDPTEIEETKRIWRRADAVRQPPPDPPCCEKKPLSARTLNPKGRYGLYCI